MPDTLIANARKLREGIGSLPPRGKIGALVKEFIDDAFIEQSVRGTKVKGRGPDAETVRAGRVVKRLDRLYRAIWDQSQKVAKAAVDLSGQTAIAVLVKIEGKELSKEQVRSLRRRVVRSRELGLEQKTALLTRHARREIDSTISTELEEAVENMRAGGLVDSQIVEQFKRLERVKSLSASIVNMLDSSYTVFSRRVAADAERAYFSKEGYETFTWVTINRPPKLCPDCSARHGVEGDMDFWEKMGLPGAGRTVCGPYCYCALVPKEYTDRSPDTFAVPLEDRREMVLTTETEVRSFDKRGPGVSDRENE